MLHELLEAGASRASSSPPWCGGTVRFINLLQIYKPQDVGAALWVLLALGQAYAVHIVVKQPSQCTNTCWCEGEEQGKLF